MASSVCDACVAVWWRFEFTWRPLTHGSHSFGLNFAVDYFGVGIYTIFFFKGTSIFHSIFSSSIYSFDWIFL